jgi:hypothetical protein
VEFEIFNFLGQAVENAAVRLRNDAVNIRVPEVKTDGDGRVEIPDLQEGEWSYQVIAAGHMSVQGTVLVVADQIVIEQVELNRNLVTIDFTVVPVPFTDRYDIVIEQTFVTNVPMPVLVVEPPFIRLENVTPGFEVTVTAKVSNKGLIDLRDVTIFKEVTEDASSIPLITYLPRLKAMQSIDIPFRVTYWGNPEASLPPGGTGGDWSEDEFDKCVDDCMNADIYNMGKFAKNLVNLIRGGANSQISGATKNQLANLALALLILNTAGGWQEALGFALGHIPWNPLTWIGCRIGCANKEMDWGDMVGEGEPTAPRYRRGTSDGGAGCFAAGTPILMADGSRQPIETVNVGDEVLCFDGKSGQVGRVYAQKSGHVRELRYRVEKGAAPPIGSELRRLKTTDDHLFWLEERGGWVAAKNLKTGDDLTLADGEAAHITETMRYPGPEMVYTMDVDDAYSFFANSVLIRQRCGGDPGAQEEKRIADALEKSWKREWAPETQRKTGGAMGPAQEERR